MAAGEDRVFDSKNLVDHDDPHRNPALSAPQLGRIEACRTGLARLGGSSTLNQPKQAPRGKTDNTASATLPPSSRAVPAASTNASSASVVT